MKLPAIALALAAALSAPASAEPFAEVAGARRVRIPADVEACTAQPFLPWCSPQERSGSIREWTISDVRAVDLAIRGRYHFKLGFEGGWRSYVDHPGKSWSGDCDSLTFTVLDQLARDGFPQDRMWRVIVNPKNNRFVRVRHMLAVIEVGGRFWVVGDASDRPYPLTEGTFEPYLFSRVSDGSGWRRAGLVQPPATRRAPLTVAATGGN